MSKKDLEREINQLKEKIIKIQANYELIIELFKVSKDNERQELIDRNSFLEREIGMLKAENVNK